MSARLFSLCFLVFLLLLAGCQTQQMSEATANPAQVFVDAGISRATAQAAAETAQYYDNLLTATAVSIQATATERAWIAGATATARAWDATTTAESAQATATARAWEATTTAASVRETAAAISTQTAMAPLMAATQSALRATEQANYANAIAYATAQAGEAESVRLAVEREKMTNQVKAIVPPVLLLATFIVAIILLYQHGRVRVIRRDERGDAPLVLDVIDGVTTDSDRNLYAQGGLRREDLKKLPIPPLALQAGVTERDQMVDLATRPGDGRTTERRREVSLPAAQTPPLARPQVELLPPDKATVIGDVIPALMMDAVEGEIKEDTNE